MMKLLLHLQLLGCSLNTSQSLAVIIFFVLKLIIQILTSVQVLQRTSVTPTLFAPTLKALTSVAALVDMKEVVKIAQVSFL